MNEVKKCPKCGKEYTEVPALSREDNSTEIYPMCGMMEALDKWEKNERSVSNVR